MVTEFIQRVGVSERIAIDFDSIGCVETALNHHFRILYKFLPFQCTSLGLLRLLNHILVNAMWSYTSRV